MKVFSLERHVIRTVINYLSYVTSLSMWANVVPINFKSYCLQKYDEAEKVIKEENPSLEVS